MTGVTIILPTYIVYVVPHPYEPKMHLRLQTHGGVMAINVLREGLNDMMVLCDDLETKYVAGMKLYERTGTNK
jgi:DNA-directed RNA polymerase I and III subunit RPAC2